MKPRSKQTTCAAAKPDGSPCSARVQEGSPFCFFHDPAKAQERLASQSRGGQGTRASSQPIDAPEFTAETVSDLGPLIVGTINQLRRREITTNEATAICNLANTLIKVLDIRDEQKLRDAQRLLPGLDEEKGLYDPRAEQEN